MKTGSIISQYIKITIHHTGQHGTGKIAAGNIHVSAEVRLNVTSRKRGIDQGIIALCAGISDDDDRNSIQVCRKINPVVVDVPGIQTGFKIIYRHHHNG